MSIVLSSNVLTLVSCLVSHVKLRNGNAITPDLKQEYKEE